MNPKVLSIPEVVAAIHTAMGLEIPELPKGEKDLSGQTREILILCGWKSYADSCEPGPVRDQIMLASPESLFTVFLGSYDCPSGNYHQERWLAGINLYKEWPDSMDENSRLQWMKSYTGNDQFDVVAPGMEVVALSMWPCSTVRIVGCNQKGLPPDPNDSPEAYRLRTFLSEIGPDHVRTNDYGESGEHGAHMLQCLGF